MNYGTMAERVNRGIEWLDEVAPEWRDRIDLRTLDLADYHWCVIAQVAGGEFVKGWEALNGDLSSNDRERQTMLGFDISRNEYYEGSEKYYGDLNVAWREALSV